MHGNGNDDNGYISITTTTMPTVIALITVSCNTVIIPAKRVTPEYRLFTSVEIACVRVAVAKLTQSHCRQVGMLELKASSGYMSSSVAEHTGCGSVESPWLITVLPGQTIQVRQCMMGCHDMRLCLGVLRKCLT